MTVCTVYYEAEFCRYSIECDVVITPIIAIDCLFNKIKEKHETAKIKTILFSEVNEIE